MVDIKAKSSIFSIIILILGLIGIISVFMAWLDFGFGITMSGWEVFNDLNISGAPYIIWMPLVVLIFSIIALIIGLIGIIKPMKEMGAGVIVSGILLVIAAILFYTYSEDGDKMSELVGIGLWLALIIGVLLIVFGALRLGVKEN